MTLFSPERLTLARQLEGLRKSELAAQIGKSSTAVAAWESGAKRPTSANIAELAMSLGVTPEFFSPRGVTATHESPVPHFRSLRSTSQRARDQALAFGMLAADIAEAVEKHVEFPHVNVPSIEVLIDDDHGAPEEAAHRLRQAWDVGTGPMGHLVRLLENHGVLVVFSPPQTSAVDAYSFESAARPVVILNPTKRDYYRQRFDIAHELGHLVMHRDAEPGGRIVEDQANRFASELLMPADELRGLLPTSMNARAWDALGALKEQWGVSIQALLFRARRLGTISDVTYRNAVITLTQRGWRRQEPGLITATEQPSMLPSSVGLLESVGIDRESLIDQARAPRDLFEVVVARTPSAVEAEQTHDARPSNVIPLLTRQHR
ncbi:XRE family transcriptional regulator [Microbacterium sp.]|uniref:XRE family transcriptional regulator n=1 Tax=Microbacterium sp. TaxID=51671 RepID=UPI00260AD5A1|nr:XRE family transcriptional regulator [Microbacterium sp.]